MKPPSVKSVMKALRSRIVVQVTSSLPELPQASPASDPDAAAPSLPAVPTDTAAQKDAPAASLHNGAPPADLSAASDSPYAASS